MIVNSLFVSGAFSHVDATKFSYDDAGRLTDWLFNAPTDTSYYGQDFPITRDDHGRAFSIVLKCAPVVIYSK